MAFARNHAAKLVALLLIVGSFLASMPPAASSGEVTALAHSFRFTTMALPELPGVSLKAIRAVNPSLERISGWISSVGAGMALADIDGDGLPNDICHVDPRVEAPLVAPAPGTPARYAPFALDGAPLKLDATMAPMGCLAGDLNEDGQSDLLVYYWGRTPIAYLRRPGSSQPAAQAYRAVEVVAGGERWYTNAATLADLDGDGHLDLVVGNYFPDGSRILDANAPEPDFMQQSMSRAKNAGGVRFLLWQQGSAASATEPSVAFAATSAPPLFDPAFRGWTLAVGAADLNGDLLPEVYMANDFGPDHLVLNQSKPGQLKFTLVEGQTGFNLPHSHVLGKDSYKGMGVEFADLNLDGRLDIAVSNIANVYGLMESHFAWINTGNTDLMARGIAPFRQEAERLGLARSGWGWDIKAADFNNDSRPEVVQATGFMAGEINRWPELQELATTNDTLLTNPAVWPRLQRGDDVAGKNPNPFFAWNGERYVDIAQAIGLGARAVTRGMAIADIDGDGDQDLGAAVQWGESYLYRNECVKCGDFLGLHLLLPLGAAGALDTMVTNGHPQRGLMARPAVGAVVKVTLPDGRILISQVDGGNGHGGKRSPDLFFGLGDLPAGTALPVEIHWRDAQGLHQTMLQLKPGWQTVVLQGKE